MSRFGGRRAIWLGVAMGVVVTAGIGGWSLVRPDPEERTITLGTTEGVTSLDPAGAYDTGSWRLFGNLYQSLMTFTPGNAEPVPDAADQCRFTDSELTVYRCTLRPGLRFSDGSALTVEDVKHSFDRVLKIAHPQGPVELFDTLKEVRADGNAVEFRLKTSDAAFPFKIAGGAGSIVDSEKYPADRLLQGGETLGSGPYALDEYEPGRRMALVPNEEYVGVLEERPTHHVEIRYYEEPEDLSTAWRDREIEVNVGHMPAAEMAGISPSDAGVRIYEQPGNVTRLLAFNLRPSSPTADTAVRQAVASLVNRTALARHVHQRTVEPLYSLIPQGVNGHAAVFHERYGNPDAERAARLLEEAGVQTPVRFEIAHAEDRRSAADEAATLSGQLESSGLFEVTVREYERDAFRDGMRKGSFDAYLVDRFRDYPDPDAYTAPLVGEDGIYHTGYTDERVERLIRATRRGYDRGAVLDRFREIHQRVAVDVPLLPLWQRKAYGLSTDDIAGTQYLTDTSGVWRLWELDRI
ncbi:ABC transporter substrate-binding protein [Streptomyces megasporus]|uniref:ABC transporter substrate-binding protein n=1 Tax=Streptomyces megasporus TaxID=44060 RepID=UPI001FE0BB71|nr:ABC transporter substrate-binding protein [Streptomyces megasporus]